MMKIRQWRLLSTSLMVGLLVSQLHAQEGHLDSLKNELTKTGLSDSMRIETLLQLGWDYAFTNTDSARTFLYQCIQLAERKNNHLKVGSAYSYIGVTYFRTDDYDSAMFYYQRAETFFKKDTSAEAEANIATNRMSMGTLALQQGEHQTAIGYYLKAINVLETDESDKDWSNLVTAYANTGLVYNDLSQFNKAMEYHKKALDICLAHTAAVGKEKTAQVQMFMVINHLNLKQYDSALYVINQASLLVRSINSPYLFSIFYGIQGRYYSELKNYEASIGSFKRALRSAAEAGQQFQQANAFLQLGMNYYHLGNDTESISNLRKSIAISRKIGDKVRELKGLEYLPKLYVRLKKNAEAVTYYQQYVHLSDSLNASDTKKKINEIENKYQAKKKQDSILVLQKNSQVQKLKLHKKQNLNIALTVGFTLLLLIAVLIYRNLHHRHRLLKQQELLRSHRVRELEKERQLVAVQSVLKGQEQERSRLARDLHDGVGGLLSGIKLSLSTMKGNVFLSESNAQSFNKVIDQLDESIGELRRVSHNMMPEALIKFGLKEALENYCENLDLAGKISVQFQAYGMENRMDQNTEIILYRIVQELLNNVIKHADAKKVLIQLMREGDRFSLTVEDDGKGFDLQDVEKKDGAGLANIKARAEYLGGTVDLKSTLGEGTSVTIEGKC